MGSIVANLIIVAFLILALVGQVLLCLNTKLGPYQFTVGTVSIEGQRLGSTPNFDHYRGFTSCEDDRFFGCLINGANNEVYVYIDEKPSSPLPNFVVQKLFVLIAKESGDEKMLRAIQVPGKYI